MAMPNEKSNINVRIDAAVKEQANAILGSMGIDQTTAIDMYYRQIIREHGLPFQPSAEPSPRDLLDGYALRNNIPVVTLEFDAAGNIILNKEEHPDIYDWVVNG
jgi:DNA-damage-inducible protein J